MPQNDNYWRCPYREIYLGVFAVRADFGTARAMTEADKFVGVWRLLSVEYRTDDGAIVESPYGVEPEGTIMYDSLGNMAAQIARKDRPRFSSSDRMAGSADEKKSAFETYVAYFGRYRVDEREGTVTQEVHKHCFQTGPAASRFVTTRLLIGS